MKNNIDKLKHKRNMSYGEIGRNAGISPQYVYLLAKGKRENPSPKVMRAISAALDVEVSKVFIM